jgi:hypothetical protein
MSRIQPKAIRDRTKEAPPSSSTRIAAVISVRKEHQAELCLTAYRLKGQLHSRGEFREITAVI